MEEKDIERFWSKVKIGQDDECWEWTASKHKGYGCIKIKDKFITSSRLSWMIHFGEIPEGLSVCHKCDNPLCVNPDHLFLGTHQDNMNDMMNKGRSNCIGVNQVGEKNKHAKLTWDDVYTIRRLYSEGNETLKSLGNRYGVHLATIGYIIQNKSWCK